MAQEHRSITVYKEKEVRELYLRDILPTISFLEEVSDKYSVLYQFTTNNTHFLVNLA